MLAAACSLSLEVDIVSEMDSLAARLLLSELWLLMLEIRRGASNFMSDSDNCISTFGTFLKQTM